MRRIGFTTALAVIVQFPGFAQQPDTARIAKHVLPSVVLIRGTTGTGEALGSGFILSSDGKIATNLHVIRDLQSGGVQLASGEIFDNFSVLAFDERRDLAVLKVAAFDAPAVTLGNSNEISAGDPVVAIGSPRGLSGCSGSAGNGEGVLPVR